MEIKFGNGKNMLYRYLIDDVKRKQNWIHPDPLFQELTYGEGGRFSTMVRNNIHYGSHIFFHSTIEGQRYITAHYFVSKVVEGYDARHNPEIRKQYQNVHIHPEKYPEWWPNYDVNEEIKDNSNDIIVFGDPEKSFGELKNPLKFDRDLAEKMEFENNRINLKIVDKNGKVWSDGECISSCTHVPRYMTMNDVILLIEKITKENF